MNHHALKKVELNEISLIELLQLNKKDEMLAIAEKQGAQVKKSHTKAKIAVALANQIQETFLEQLGYLRSSTMAVIETLTAQTESSVINLSQEQLTELSELESEGYLYIHKENDDAISIALALELIELTNEIRMDQSKQNTIKTNQKLVDYTLALTHMYGVYHVKQLIKVWNTYQTKPLDDESIAEKMNHIGTKQTTVKWNGTVIYDQSFLNEKEACSFYDTLQSRNIPYFMPSQKDLEWYLDFSINRQSPYYLNIHNFIHSKVYADQTEEQIMSEINKSVILGIQPHKVYETLSKIGLTFTAEDEVITFVQLFQELSNQTRKWSYRGWTPDEVEGLKEKEPTKKEPVTVNKIGRNEPCPCGSGKKYKKCHGQ